MLQVARTIIVMVSICSRAHSTEELRELKESLGRLAECLRETSDLLDAIFDGQVGLSTHVSTRRLFEKSETGLVESSSSRDKNRNPPSFALPRTFSFSIGSYNFCLGGIWSSAWLIFSASLWIVLFLYDVISLVVTIAFIRILLEPPGDGQSRPKRGRKSPSLVDGVIEHIKRRHSSVIAGMCISVLYQLIVPLYLLVYVFRVLVLLVLIFLLLEAARVRDIDPR